MGLPPQVKVDRCIFHHTLNTIPPHFMQHLQPWPDVPPSIKVWLPLSTSWCSKNSHNSRSTLVGIKKKQPTKKRQTAFGKCVRLSYHNKASQIGWLRTRKFILSWFWRLEIQLRHQQGHAVSKDSRKNPLFHQASGGCQQSLVFLDLQMFHSNLRPSCCVSLTVSLLFS